MKGRALRIAIIGAGPRALGAIEALLRALDQDWNPLTEIAITLFDPQPHLGAGPNFTPSQSALCLLNIPLRDINLPESPAGFVPFTDWLPPEERAPDHFPSRAAFGAWSAARFAALRGVLPSHIQLVVVPGSVEALIRRKTGWDIGGQLFDEILLLPGQPATSPDPQRAAWQGHACVSGAQMLDAYPANGLLARSDAFRGQAVAVRGLGLATLDVLRLLTLGRGGRMEGARYIPSGAEPLRILPFSRNGLPPWPKPATEALDRRFDLSEAEEEAFVEGLQMAMECSADRCLEPVCNALVAPAIRIMADCKARSDEADIRRWLKAESKEAGAAETRDGAAVLLQGIAMAEGAIPPDAGYVIGQIWRKLQPHLREGFNLRQPEGSVAARVIDFDEGLKRYSYGPPISTLRELQALVAAGLVSLQVADDPDIGLVSDGWRLAEDGAHIDASVLIDAVLPGPKIETLSDALFIRLREAGLLAVMEETGGACTDRTGQVLDATGARVPGLSLLGRLATGSVIAADSLHDCLGESAARWAARILSSR